jgi:Zn-dependent protease/CBS domain-containing protein
MLGRQSFKIMTLFGLPVRIDPTWFIILALVTWSLAEAYFPDRYPGQTAGIYWTLGLVGAVMLFASVLLHELGHAVTAKRNDVPVGGITLFMFGGVSELSDEPPSPGTEAKVTLCGWLISAGLALVFYGLYRVTGDESGPAAMAQVLFGYLALVNALLFVFNGLPGFPLDGGRLLRALLWRITGSLRKATYVASQIGAGFGLALILFGVLTIIGGGFVGGLWFALIGLFLRSGAQASYTQLMVRQALQGVPVSRVMSHDVISVDPSASLRDVVDDYFMEHHHRSFPVARDGRLVGTVRLEDVKEFDRAEWDTRQVRDLLERKKGEEVLQVDPRADTMDVLKEMARTGQGRVSVVENDELVGIVSRRDIMHVLAVKTDLAPEDVAS